MGEPKPFVCRHAGCQKTFANVDHLSVHTNKHGLKRLHFDLPPSDDASKALAFADQTPTPTKFFRVEEGHLFEDISAGGASPANPFDDPFRKAAAAAAAEANSSGVADSVLYPAAEASPDGKRHDDFGKTSREPGQRNQSGTQGRNRSKDEVPLLRLNLKVRGRPNSDGASPQRSPSSPRNKMFLRGPDNELIPVDLGAPYDGVASAEAMRYNECHIRRNSEVDVNSGSASGRKNDLKYSRKQSVEEEEEEEDEEEKHNLENDVRKREKLLARNRAAAVRARRKKKVLMGDLEKNCNDLVVANEALKLQVDSLRKELLSVKELLKEHVVADCHVASSQVAAGRLPADVASHWNRRFFVISGDKVDAVSPVTLLLS